MKYSVLASLALLSVFSTAYAKEIYKSRDWKLNDLSSRSNPNGNCVAYTTVKKGRTRFYFEVSHPKNKEGRTEIQVRQEGKGPQSWVASPDSATTISFASIGKIGKSEIIWNIPQGSQRIFEFFSGSRDLNFVPADGSRDIGLKFEPNGFVAVRQKMEEVCLGGRSLLDDAFEQSFIRNTAPLNVSALTVDSAKALKGIVDGAYAVHLQIRGNQNDVNALERQFAPQFNEMNSLTNLLSRLNTRDIPNTINGTQANDALEVAKKSELIQINSLITSQSNSVSTAQRSLDNARSALAPFQQEHSSLSSAVNQADGNRAQDSSRLNSIDQGIAQNESRISSLSSEAGSLQAQNNRLRNDLRQATQDQRQAHRRLRGFDAKLELRARIQRDRPYQQAERELPALRSNLMAFERAMNEAHGKVLVREAELRACQAAGPIATISQAPSYRLPAQERPQRPNRGNRPAGDRPERPNRPGRPGNAEQAPTPATPTPAPETPATTPQRERPSRPSTPAPAPAPETTAPSTPTPTTPAAADCSRQVEALRVARVVENDLKTKKQQVEQNIANVQGRMNAIQRRIDAEITREQSILERDAEITARRADQIERELIGNERRIEVISNRELPAAYESLRSFEDARPSALASLNQSISAQGSANSNLNAFERRVGWNAKVSAVQNASSVLRQRTSDLNSTQSLKYSTESIIANCQSERTRLNNLLAQLQQSKVNSEARLANLEIEVQAYDTKKQELQAKENDLKNQLAAIATQYESQLPR